MADNVQVTAGSGTSIAADEVVDATLGTVKVGYVKIMDGTIDGTGKASVGSNGLSVDVKASVNPTGAATAANQTTMIGHLDGVEGLLTTIDADTGTIAGAISGTEMQVDVVTMPTVTVQDGGGSLTVDAASLPLPTGASTAANQSTIIGHVDGIETLLGTIDADTSLLAGTVSGTELQVDVITMPTVNVADGGGSLSVDDGGNTISIDDGGGTITVDGTVSVSGSVAVTNAALSVTGGGTEASALRVTLANDSTGVVSIDDNGGSITVDASSLPLPTGASTAANQSTIIGHVDGIETLLGTIDADTSTLAGAVSGTEMQVDIVSAPTLTVQATNLDVRDLSSASDSVTVHGDVGVVDQFDLTNSNPIAVAIVDGSGDQISSFGGGVQYTEGGTDASITGTAMLWEDTSDTLRPVSAAKPLPVNIVSGSSSGTEYTEGDVDASITGTAILAEGPTNTLTPLQVNASSNLKVNVENASIPVTDNGGSLTVDGTVAATQSGTWNITNVSGTVSLPTGAATAANQATVINHLDGIEAFITTIDADTSTLAGAVSGTEMQVDIVSAPTLNVADAGGSLTIDNAALSVTGGGVEASALRVTIANDSTGVVSIDDNGGSITVDGTVAVSSSALPTGASTAANQSTIIGHLDGVEGLLTTIDADTSALAGAVSGTELQVDIVSAPTLTVQATNLDVRDLTSASDSVAVHGDVGILDQLDLTNSNPAVVAIVDGSGDQITSFGGGTQYTEGDTDATITGTAMLMEGAGNALVVAQGTAADGLLVNLGSNNDVTVSSSALPTGASTAANQTTIIGHVDGIEGLLTTIDADTSALAAAVSGTEVQVDVVTMPTVTVQDGGGSLTVDGTLAVTQSGSWSLAANQSVNVAQINGVTTTMGNGASGTGVQRVTIADDSTGQIISRGNVAHDAVDSGNPVKIGLKAVAHSSNPTAVAAGDRTDWYANRHGIPFMIGGHPNVVTVRTDFGSAASSTGQAIVTVGSGVKIVVTALHFTVSNATTVNVSFLCGFSTTTTMPSTTGVVAAHPGIPPGGGIALGSGAGILGIGADGEDLRVTTSAATSGDAELVVTYYTIES